MGSAAVGVALAIAGFTWLLAIAEWLGLHLTALRRAMRLATSFS